MQSLYIGLTGREWLIKRNAFFLLSLLVASGRSSTGSSRTGSAGALWDAIPLILAFWSA